MVVDDGAAEQTGEWMPSTSVKSYVGGGYLHDLRAAKGEKKLVYRADLPKSGEYEVRMSYNASDSRTSRAMVRVTHRDGEAVVRVNQQKAPDYDGLFQTIGRFHFNNDVIAAVTISNEDSDDGFVIADAVWFDPVMSSGGNPPAAVAAGDSSAEPAVSTAEQLARMEAEHQKLSAQLAEMKKNSPATPPEVLSIRNEEKMGDYCLCIRGNVHQLGEPVPRSFLQVAMTNEAPKIPENSSGRLELAQWIASRDNPLTARVYVNRVWQKLFGEGLVRSVDNFGIPGDRPTHPELLDHLASEFMADGWSTKRLIRRILLSETWRMSCERSEQARAADPDNRLLAAQNRQRLDAEAIRDSLQAVSRTLNPAMGGDTVRPGTKSEYGYEFDEGRRSVYLPILRNRLPDTFSVFDFPDPNLSTGKRATSTLPTQALYLMNSEFVRSMASTTAAWVLSAAPGDEERLTLLYTTALGRLPSAEERYAAVQFLSGEDSKKEPARAWTNIIHAVFSSIDFRYVD